MGTVGLGFRAASVWVVRGGLLLLTTTSVFAACGSTHAGSADASAAGANAGADVGGKDGSSGSGRGGSSAGRANGGSAGSSASGANGAGAGSSTGGASGAGAGDDDDGTSAGGANDGSAGGGAAGRGGNANGGAAGGSVGPSSKLGRACSSTLECADAKFPALTCVTGKDTVLGGGAPPKGLCTMPCDLPTQANSEDACEKVSPGALCFPFNGSSTTGYCVEGCTFGAPGLGEPEKCHSRAEFACNPALLGATAAPCQANGDCELGELCSNGFCNVVFPGCLPSCAGDIDCEAGMYCDQSFLSGVCVTKKQTGKTLGEPCTPPAPNEPDEPDECLGYCAPDSANSAQGHCISTCTYGSACAWNTTTKKYDGACILVNNQIVGASPDVGDMGFCDLTCDCAADCMDPTLGCELLDQPLAEQFRGGGLCLEPVDTSVPYDQCGAAGAGGAGGPQSSGIRRP